MYIVIYMFIGQELIKKKFSRSHHPKNFTEFQVSMLLSDYVFGGKYCGIQEMCRVKQLVLRIWGPEKMHFRCSLLWITSRMIPGTEGPFVAVVPSWCAPGAHLSVNFIQKESSSCSPKPRHCKIETIGRFMSKVHSWSKLKCQCECILCELTRRQVLILSL